MTFPLKVIGPDDSFLGSLRPYELNAFLSRAQKRTFARGSQPMREGDDPDYVMVIVNGVAQISASENGRAEIITRRGPGQLVGEVGALRVNVRSATMTALDTVDALVMRTEDFADFLSDHQRVRAIVDSQIDDRLTERPYRRGGRLHPEPSPRPALTGENCTVILTDVVGFGSHKRNDRDRRVIRAAHQKMLRGPLGHLWDKCIIADQGDGLLLVIPPAIPTTTVMERLHRSLPGALRLHNQAHGEAAHIQLRLAATVGPVMNDSVGVTGEALIRVARLLDAPVLRETMASTSAVLGIIVSMFIHETTIRHAEGWTDPDDYRAVEVRVKESLIQAWMQLFGQSPPQLGTLLGSRGPLIPAVPWSYA
jgi:hypothetical protein